MLKAWAVPKGPATDPSDKRPAVRNGDHSLDYAMFEGAIPEGEYGGGTVIVWDTGEYGNQNHKDDQDISMFEALDEDHVPVWLHGQKLTGGYSLIHTRMRGQGRSWLLIKERGDKADAWRNPVSMEPESVVSGLSLEEMDKRMQEQEKE